jgi:hypothetical protein
LLTGMTSNTLHMQRPLTSQSHGSVSQREQLVFLLWIKLHATGLLYLGTFLKRCLGLGANTGPFDFHSFSHRSTFRLSHHENIFSTCLFSAP